MTKLILTELWNCDHCNVVEIPSRFVVEVSYNDETNYVEVFFSDDDTLGGSYLYKLILYVEEDNRNFASYACTHTIFTDFCKEVVKYIVDDVARYMKTGLYFDEDEEDFDEDECHETFDISYYTERWEEFIREFLTREEPKYTYQKAKDDKSSNVSEVNEEDKL